MWMFLNEHEKKKEQEISKNEQKPEKHKEVKVEAAKTALKVTILFAKLAQAKAEENVIQLWTESFPDSIQSFTEPTSGLPFWLRSSSWSLFLLCSLIPLWHGWWYIHIYTVWLWWNQGMVFCHVRAFWRILYLNMIRQLKDQLLHNQGEENRWWVWLLRALLSRLLRLQQALLCLLLRLLRALCLLLRLLQALCLLLWLFRALGILRLLRALGITRLLRALALIGVLSRLLAGWTLQLLRLRVAANQGLRRRNGRSRAREISLLVTPMGQRYHCDSECRGLRNARPLSTCVRCPQCGPVQYRSVVNLYSLEFEHALHSDVNHVSGGEVKEYTACAICMKG